MSTGSKTPDQTPDKEPMDEPKQTVEVDGGPDPEDDVTWVTVDNLTVPCLVRDGSRFVAVRMMESKLLAKYPSQSAQELHNMPPLASFYMTHREADLLTKVNVEQCSKQFGDEDFTKRDLIVKLADFKEFYGAVKKLFSGKLSEKGGWCQIANTLIPYVIRGDKEKFIPLNVVRFAAGLLTNIKVPYVHPTDEECFLLNEKCKSATMNFVFTVSTKLVSLDRVKEVCPDVKLVDDPKTAMPTGPAFMVSSANVSEAAMFTHRNTSLFSMTEPMPWAHDFAHKDPGLPWGGPTSPLYSDSLSTPRAALMLERMAAWSKLQEELHLNNIQQGTELPPPHPALGMHQRVPPPANPPPNTQIPSPTGGPASAGSTNIDQQSILQKIGVNVNIHLNGSKFDEQDTEQIKNKRKGGTPLRYSPSEQSEGDRLYDTPVSMSRSPAVSSTSGSISEAPLSIGRAPPPMYNFRPGYRPSILGSSYPSPLGSTGSVPGSPPGSSSLPTSPMHAMSPFGYPPAAQHLMQHQLPGLPLWKYDYLKNTFGGGPCKLPGGEMPSMMLPRRIHPEMSRAENPTDDSSRFGTEASPSSAKSGHTVTPAPPTPVTTPDTAPGDTQGNKSTNLEVVIDGVRCVPVIGKVLLQTKQIQTMFHEAIGCDLVVLEEIAREFFPGSSDVMSYLVHIATGILHIPTYNIMLTDTASTPTPAWSQRVAVRLDDLVRNIDILKYLVNQKKEKQRIHHNNNNNVIPIGMMSGSFMGMKRPARDNLDEELKCKIPRLSPSAGAGSVGLPKGPYSGFPLGLASPVDYPQWAQAMDKQISNASSSSDIKPSSEIKTM